MELLFSYGTLQQENVQLANFGRTLNGTKDALRKHTVGEVRITDKKVIKESGKDIHPILRYTDNPRDEVICTVFELTAKELAQTDVLRDGRLQKDFSNAKVEKALLDLCCQ